MCEFPKTMKSIVLTFLAVQLISADSNCVFDKYSTDPASQPIFLQKFGRESLLVPVKSSGISISESSFVEIYCPHGFRRENLNSDTKDRISAETKSVQITCTNRKINGRDADQFYEFDQEDKLFCKRPAVSMFQTHHLMCGDEAVSYIIGMEYGQEYAILAEICYDLDMMKPKYQNYMSAKRSPVISHQSKYSPIRFYPFGEGPVDIISATFNLPIEKIQERIQEKVGVLHGSVDYIYEELIPEDAFEPFFFEPLFAANFLGKTLWWRGLKKGNWRLFESVLKSRSQYETYDVVLGTSGIVKIPSSSPDCDLMREFSFEVNSITQSAPMFVWAYLIAENYTLREEFVVIGVNSPYFEFFPRYETVICRDICHSIRWLAPLNKFRHLSSFGYVYCCDVNEVKHKLDGIPEIYLKRQHEYQYKSRLNEQETEPDPEAEDDDEENEITTAPGGLFGFRK